MLSEDERALLIRYLSHVELNSDQRDRLAAKYWEASAPERREITLAYHKLFTDGEFVSRLLVQHDLHRAGGAAASPASSGARAEARPFPTDSENHGATHGDHASSSNNSNGGSQPASPSTSLTHAHVVPRRTHSQMLLRAAVQDQFQKLVGGGPFTLAFEVVAAEEQRKAIIDLYASQFEYPDPAELHSLVTLPPVSTRTRRRTYGSYTWYLRCLDTDDIVCAVTVTSHHYDNHRFVEMPLFATAAGYKRCGFGRLLNAALRTWCRASEFEFIMISADIKAIPFWHHLGYEMMSRQEKNGIAFYYEHECYTFNGAEPMICYCHDRHARKRPRVISSSPLVELNEVEVELKKMTRFVVSGKAELPTP